MNGTPTHVPLLRACAALLDYPGAELQAHVDALAQAVTNADAANVRRLEPLLVHVARSELMDLQEQYVDTFDRGRRTSLNLFEHVHGDSRDRGQAMVDLLAMYRDAGLVPAGDELPDYLPAFLEFLSLQPQAVALEHLGEVTHLLRAIGGVLAQRGSPYAGAFDALLALAGEAPLARGADDPAADDTTPAAIDAAWVDAPVDFLGAAAPCGPAARPAVSTIQLHRRTA